VVSGRLLECELWNRINAQQLQNSHSEGYNERCEIAARSDRP
jgi:hypothetical protein